MDYYYNEFSKLKEEFHEVMHNYPVFSETIQDIEDKDIKEINELLDKNDEFYLKQAIKKIKHLIEYVKNTSEGIKKEYDTFDRLAVDWDKLELGSVTDKELRDINYKVREANELIKSHNLDDLRRANSIMRELIKNNK